MFTHLSWPEAPRFASRLLFMQAISSFYEEIAVSEDERVGKELEGLSNSVFAVAKDTVSFIDSQSSARFESLLSDLGSVAKAQPMTTGLAGQVRDHFVSTTSLWRCSNCTQDTICSGRDVWSDDRTLSEKGKCIALLNRIFGSAVALARSQYPFAVNVTLDLGSELRRAPDLTQAPVAGSTGTHSSNPTTRRLALVIDPDRFDRSAFLSVFFVLFHESFVHGLAGLAPGDPEALLADPFAEGWMDWIAVQLLKKWANSTVKHEWPFSLRQAFSSNGEAYHFARMHKTNRYQTGALAGQRLFNAICVMDTIEVNAWNTFLRFSVHVNASSLSGAKRGALVRAVNAALIGSTDRGDRQAFARQQAFEAIDRFVTKPENWQDLIKEMIEAAKPLLAGP